MRSKIVKWALFFVSETALLCYRVCSLLTPSRHWRRERLGGGDWISIFSQYANRRQGPIWIHAASVGEVRGIAPLLRALGPGVAVVGSTTSRTGKSEFKKLNVPVALLPFDARSLLRTHFRQLRPCCIVLNETELWPSLVLLAREQGIPVYLVNARISDRTFPRYKRLGVLTSMMLQSFEAIFAQSDVDARRLRALGGRPERVEMLGSTKYDTKVSLLSREQRAQAKTDFGLYADKPCVVAGSVRQGEFEQVLDAFLTARERLPELQLVLAPRHPEYFDEVADYLSYQGVAFHRRSHGLKTQSTVLLLDTLGELSQAYRAADVAFVGGTLVPIGGHNPLEPSALGLPVLFGPHVNNVASIAKELCSAGAARTVCSASELADQLVSLCAEQDVYQHASAAAVEVCRGHQGAVQRILSRLPLRLAGKGVANTEGEVRANS